MKNKHLLLTTLITFACLIGGGAIAQTTVTIGSDGTNYQNVNQPFYAKANYSYSQQIYTLDEIGGEGTISSIAFYPTTNNCSRNLDIYLVTTTKETFSSTNDWISISGIEPVFSGNVSFITGDWNTITLTNSFIYNGNNLAVIVHDKTGSAESADTKFLYDYYFPTNTCLRKYGESLDLSNLGYGSRDKKNKIQLNITYYYPKPYAISSSSITSESASFSWTAPTATTGHTLSGYQYRYKAANGSWTSETTTEAVSCNLSSLTPYTNYTFQVRAIYIDSSKDTHYSAWAEVTFVTSCTVPTTTWGFEGSNDMPLGWEITAFYNSGSTTYPKIYNSSSYSHNSSRSIQFYYTNTNEEIIQMPAINETLNGKTLSFYAKNDGGYNTTYSIIIGYYNEYNVFVAPEGSIITITNSAYDNDNDQIGYYKYDITGWPNDIRKIAIKGYTTYSNSRYIYLDDVKIDYTTSCSPVSSPTVGTVNYNSAQLSWTAGGSESNWKLQYKDEDDNDWTIINVDSNPYTLTGLTENTTYIWKVAAWCDTSDDSSISTYIAGDNFTTPVQYPAPTSLAANNITANTADITWAAGSTETAWQLYYSSSDYATPENAAPGDIINVSTTPTYSMTGLTRNTTYYVYVRANYGEDHYSSWTEAISFKTSITLPYSYDFTDASELGAWTLYDCVSSTGINGNVSNYYFSFVGGSPNPQHLITPAFENNSNALLVSFDYKINTGTAPYPILNVGYSTTDKDIDSFTWPSSATINVNSTSYQKFEYIFPTEGIKYISIKYDRNGTYLRVDIDNISFTPFDKVFEGVGEYWDALADWIPEGLPTVDDDVYINHAVIISDNAGKTLTATANNITLGPNGSITIPDGGQLICNNAVNVTAKKNISAWTNGTPVGGWHFIASPISTDVNPEDAGLITENQDESLTYDLYYLNNTTWKNYRQNAFNLSNGQGYLYANSTPQQLSFTGSTKPYSEESNSVDVAAGWNLIGNPYTFNTYVNQSYYKLNDARTDIEAVDSNDPIAPCTGIIVKAAEEDSVTFSKTQSGNSKCSIGIMLAKVGTRNNATIDNAIVSFNEGSKLEKFYFGNPSANLYIPQDNEEYAIVSGNAQGEIPVNFKANENGQYTLTVNTESVEMNYLHLIDNMTGDNIDLLATPSYTFNAKTTDHESRFRLLFAANGIEENGISTSSATFAYINNGEIIVNGEGMMQVMDVTGRIIVSRDGVHTVSTQGMAPGVYVIRLINGDSVRSQKIVVK